MRLFLLMAVLLPFGSPAQPSKRPAGPSPRRTGSAKPPEAKPTLYSASSDWHKVTLQATPPLPTAASSSRRNGPAEPRPVADRPPSNPSTSPAAVGTSTSATPVVDAPSSTVDREAAPTRTTRPSAFRPAFTGDFSTNRNGWRAGNRGDYNFQIGLGRYSVRKRIGNTKQVAFSYVALPPDINLNRADTFTIRVDVLADSGQVPTGGLLFGVRDSLNYCAFTTNGQGEISIKRVQNGAVLNEDMPGDYFRPGVPLDRNRNRLTIKRRGDALHFYVNEQEVRSSPYPFRLLSGNGIGVIASGYWTQFQKLSVALGP